MTAPGPLGGESEEVSERPRHEVDIAEFEIDATEVTVADYAACVD
jgi:formylglycine-generating enzyme required for sulfatase activity